MVHPISTTIKFLALDAGFDLCGIAPVSDFPELTRFPEWIAKGHAGEMKYLESRDDSGQLRRAAALNSIVPWARTVIVCAVNYNTAQPYSTQVNTPGHGWISRYAWSREDYHDSVLRRLREVEAKIKEAGPLLAKNARNGAPQTIFPHLPTPGRCGAPQPGSGAPPDETPIETRCYVDTGPVVERVYAKYAGIGWLGKNTCLINQKIGSWLFLGVIITSVELAPDLPAPDRCGTCTRCIEACPTQAFIGPHQLDANKCIAYLTIEKRGSIPEELRAQMGHHVFGCDICQDVCPWNRKAPATEKPEFQPREGLVNPALDWLAEISEEEFREKFRGSPIKRAKRNGLRRNALIAIGNSGDPKLATVAEKATNDPDPAVAEAAEWARERLTAKGVDSTAAER